MGDGMKESTKQQFRDMPLWYWVGLLVCAFLMGLTLASILCSPSS